MLTPGSWGRATGGRLRLTNGPAGAGLAAENRHTMKKGTRTCIKLIQPRGFTLVEIMVTVAIVAIIAAVALPSFTDSIRKGRRSEAFAALAALQQAQERRRGNNPTYTTSLLDLNITAPSRYTLAIAALPAPASLAQGYVAAATGQGSQAEDGACKVLAVRLDGGNISYGSGAAAADWTDPGRCWAR